MLHRVQEKSKPKCFVMSENKQRNMQTLQLYR